jgi:hypothetical protein
MNEIGPGIAKIQSKTFAAGISACTSMYMYTARKNIVSRRRKVSICLAHKWTFLDSLAVPCFMCQHVHTNTYHTLGPTCAYLHTNVCIYV